MVAPVFLSAQISFTWSGNHLFSAVQQEAAMDTAGIVTTFNQ